MAESRNNSKGTELAKDAKTYQRGKDQYLDRFHFRLTINIDGEEKIICIRDFNNPDYDPESLGSLELQAALRDVVNQIKQDLVAKSRTYLWYNRDEPFKLTGYKNTLKKVEVDEEGNEVEKEPETWETPTFMELSEVNKPKNEEKPEEWSVTYKFTFLVDSRVIYEEIWDGRVYPKFVRNSVDLSNSDKQYRDLDPMRLPGWLYMIKHLNEGRADLSKYAINSLRAVMSEDWKKENGPYHTTFDGSVAKIPPYGYTIANYSRQYINGFRKATERKTAEYFKSIIPSDRSIEYINKYL